METMYLVRLQFEADGPAVEGEWALPSTARDRYTEWVGLSVRTRTSWCGSLRRLAAGSACCGPGRLKARPWRRTRVCPACPATTPGVPSRESAGHVAILGRPGGRPPVPIGTFQSIGRSLLRSSAAPEGDRQPGSAPCRATCMCCCDPRLPRRATASPASRISRSRGRGCDPRSPRRATASTCRRRPRPTWWSCDPRSPRRATASAVTTCRGFSAGTVAILGRPEGDRQLEGALVYAQPQLVLRSSVPPESDRQLSAESPTLSSSVLRSSIAPEGDRQGRAHARPVDGGGVAILGRPGGRPPVPERLLQAVRGDVAILGRTADDHRDGSGFPNTRIFTAS